MRRTGGKGLVLYSYKQKVLQCLIILGDSRCDKNALLLYYGSVMIREK